MIIDGYGNEVAPDEFVENYRRWAHKVAGSMVRRDDARYDDLVQEALIKAWRTAESKPEVSAVYITMTMRHRMHGVLTGTPMTGGDSKPGPKSRPAEVRADWQDPEDHDYFGRLLEGPDLLSSVELAYHHGDFAAALSSLQPRDREYVFSRFWEGKTDTEIAAEMGVTNKMLGNRWKRTIVPVLVASLSVLSDA